MTDYDFNIYYNPEKCGLETVATLDEDLSYEFNTLLVVKDKYSGKLFFASDAGCSCPTPFEDYYFKGADNNNLEELTKSNLENFERQVQDFPVDMGERQKMIVAVRALLSN